VVLLRLFANQDSGLDHYFREVSGGRFSMLGTVGTGWYPLPKSHAAWMTFVGAEYGSRFDVMSGALLVHPIGSQKSILGWIAPDRIRPSPAKTVAAGLR
jgi:hypothetical protein